MFRREAGRGRARGVAVVAAAADEAVPVVADDAGAGTDWPGGREVERAVHQAGTGAGQAGILQTVRAVLGDRQGSQLASSPSTDIPLLTDSGYLRFPESCRYSTQRCYCI